MVSFVPFVARYTPKHHLLVLKGGQIKLEEGTEVADADDLQIFERNCISMMKTLLKAQVAVWRGSIVAGAGHVCFVDKRAGRRVGQGEAKKQQIFDLPRRAAKATTKRRI